MIYICKLRLKQTGHKILIVMTTITGWTPEVMKQLQDWATEMDKNSSEHKKFATRIHRYEQVLTFSSITLGGISSMLQIMLTSLTPQEKSGDSGKSEFTMFRNIGVTTTVLTSVVTILSVIQKQTNLQVLRDRHWTAANQFTQLAIDIRTHLMLPTEMRLPFPEFLKDMALKRVTLLQSEPSLPVT